LNAVSFDVSSVCTGFIYALTVAHAMMLADVTYKKALVIGAETYSRILDWNDRKTCVFFGDGAGAVTLGDVPADLGIKSTFLKTDGSGANVIRFAAGGSRYPTSSETLKNNMHRFEMDGPKVWDFAVKAFPEAVRNVVGKSGCCVGDISKLISHQANINIIKHSMEDLGLSLDKTYTNLDKYGNTSGASIPIALAEAHTKGFFSKNDNVVLVGFGGGLSSGAVFLKWALE
jgi:3-oxoacyl-[acyl-carrier-protein] synthase-3